MLNPSMPGPAGMVDGARELGKEEGLYPDREGLTGTHSVLGFEDTGPCLGVCGGSDLCGGDPPHGFVGGLTQWKSSRLREGGFHWS